MANPVGKNMANGRENGKEGDEIGRGARRRYPLRNQPQGSPNESGELNDSLPVQAEIGNEPRRSLFVSHRSSSRQSENRPTSTLSDPEPQQEPASRPRLVHLHQRTQNAERQLQQQAEQLRTLDELCERLSRMHTQFLAERVRHSERIAANQETVEDLDLRTNAVRRELDTLERDFRDMGVRVESNTGHIQRLGQEHNVATQQMLDMRRDINRYATRRSSNNINTNNRPPLNLKLPVFSAKANDRPLQFLNAITKYIRAIDFHEENLHSILDQALQGTPHDWWEFIEDRVVDFADFRTRFLDRYWNDAAQDRVRRELFEGRYRNDSHVSMADYALQIYNRARYLDDAPGEAGIVRRLTYHFDRDVRRALAGRHIDRIENLIDLLEELDQIDPLPWPRENSRNNQNFEGRNSNSGGDMQNQSNGFSKNRGHAPNQNWRNPGSSQQGPSEAHNDRANDNKPYNQRPNRNNPQNNNNNQQTNINSWSDQSQNRSGNSNNLNLNTYQNDSNSSRRNFPNNRNDNNEINQIDVHFDAPPILETLNSNDSVVEDSEN